MGLSSTRLTSELSASTLDRMLDLAAQIGLDPTAILSRAGVSVTHGEARSHSVARLCHEKFDAVYAQCVIAMEAHANHQCGRLSLELNEHRMMCYCIITCSTLREAILRASEFLEMLAPRAGRLFLRVDGNVAEVELDTNRRHRTASSFVADMVGLSAFHQLFGWLVGQHIELIEAETDYPPVLEPLLFLAHFPVPLTFGADSNRITFSAGMLDLPVVRDYSELVKLLEVFPFDFDGPEYRLRTVSEHVRALCMKALAAHERPPSLDALAPTFNQSVSTFRRRLAEEGTSLNQIRQECRRSMAIKLLERPKMPLLEVARRLGFAEVATFRRAFKLWTGRSPGAFREATNRGPAPPQRARHVQVH
jgi:AraC-like DNA-binding protein